ncbi:MAG: DUF1802 family protein [Chthonomonadales bacterium]
MKLDRAFKEWAIVCESLLNGTQTVLLRKGGIREEGGHFRIDGTRFLLMPTYEHQNADLLRDDFKPLVNNGQYPLVTPDAVDVCGWAEAAHILKVSDESHLGGLSSEHIWNEKYIQTRLDFNPYDPLFVMVLRAYRLPKPEVIQMRTEYVGCKSWVTLVEPIDTDGSIPAIPDSEFHSRLEAIHTALDRHAT